MSEGKKKLRWLLFFLVRHNSSTHEGLASVEYNASCLRQKHRFGLADFKNLERSQYFGIYLNNFLLVQTPLDLSLMFVKSVGAAQIVDFEQ